MWPRNPDITPWFLQRAHLGIRGFNSFKLDAFILPDILEISLSLRTQIQLYWYWHLIVFFYLYKFISLTVLHKLTHQIFFINSSARSICFRNFHQKFATRSFLYHCSDTISFDIVQVKDFLSFRDLLYSLNSHPGRRVLHTFSNMDTLLGGNCFIVANKMPSGNS